ncbi:hypothetical protein GMST_03810 [Geomonas silvestris]|uniref:t-SNARE coiled-coil homology domain-containing protein n=1 Tax=Geomonas silvestris TaxID=2740184 RepID=A0A6V8MDJ1_9BACT|nr:hypothetical protein GMST_03810 [Geomonas silvestris]
MPGRAAAGPTQYLHSANPNCLCKKVKVDIRKRRTRQSFQTSGASGACLREDGRFRERRDRDAEALDRNVEALDRNVEALDRNAEALDRDSQALDRDVRVVERLYLENGRGRKIVG